MDAMSMIPVNSNSGWGDGGAAAVGTFLGSSYLYTSYDAYLP